MCVCVYVLKARMKFGMVAAAPSVAISPAAVGLAVKDGPIWCLVGLDAYLCPEHILKQI